MSNPWDSACLPNGDRDIEREIAYLRYVLTETAPGGRVIDLGCGTGEHAVGLACAGFTVTGLDVAEGAIAEARRQADRAGVAVRWEVVDLLAVGEWPVGQADAAVSIHAFGWGSDAHQRSLLRRLRRSLVPGGVLILAQPDALWELRNFVGRTMRVVGRTTYQWDRQFHLANGRITGTLTVSAPGQAERVVPHDHRLYSTAELATLTREGGFLIDRIDGDFTPSGSAARCRTVQIVARGLPTPPGALAVATWGTPPEPGLELRYAPDETAWLEPSPQAIWEAAIRDEGTDAAGHYAVDDPYGAERGVAVVARHFGCPVPSRQLTFGPGVTSLLCDLAGLAEGGLVVAPRLTHPDVDAWSVARGGEVRLLDEVTDTEGLIAAVEALRPTLLHLDRPTVAGNLIALADLEAVSRAAARVGAVVLVDESPASCLGPAQSCAPLILRVPNLVVVRGLTKAYSCAGLRVGFALASASVAPRVRELVAPVQVSEPAYRAALRLLECGDVFSHLRARVAITKPETIALLEAIGLDVVKGHPHLPWVLVADVGRRASLLFGRAGVRALGLAPPPVPGARPAELLHLSVPLSDERRVALRRHLGALSKTEFSPRSIPRTVVP